MEGSMNWFRNYVQRIAGYERTVYKFHALECILDGLERHIVKLETRVTELEKRNDELVQ
jgi:hypothetical protein